MGQPACLEEEEQKTFRTTQPLKWPDLVLAGALVGALFPSVKNKLNQAVSIDDSGTRDAPSLSIKCLFTIFQSSASTTMSLLNKSQELQSIAVALTLSLSFSLALTASSSAPYSSRELFTELKELQPINTPPPTKEPFKTVDALGPTVRSINVGTHKIERPTLKPFSMVQVEEIF